MSLHWYACISTNTYCFETHHISLETDWWALSNASSTLRIRSAVHEIFADKAFTATDGLISQLFVVTFVHPTFGAFQCNLVCENQSTGCRDISWMKFVTSAMEDEIPRWLQHCHKTCYKKGGCCGRWACMFWRWFHYGDVISGQMDLHMTIG